MKSFKGGMEIRLTQGDLQEIIQDFFNEEVFKFTMDKHAVTRITLHLETKYAVRVSISPTHE